MNLYTSYNYVLTITVDIISQLIPTKERVRYSGRVHSFLTQGPTEDVLESIQKSRRPLPISNTIPFPYTLSV